MLPEVVKNCTVKDIGPPKKIKAKKQKHSLWVCSVIVAENCHTSNPAYFFQIWAIFQSETFCYVRCDSFHHCAAAAAQKPFCTYSASVLPKAGTPTLRQSLLSSAASSHPHYIMEQATRGSAQAQQGISGTSPRRAGGGTAVPRLAGKALSLARRPATSGCGVGADAVQKQKPRTLESIHSTRLLSIAADARPRLPFFLTDRRPGLGLCFRSLFFFLHIVMVECIFLMSGIAG